MRTWRISRTWLARALMPAAVLLFLYALYTATCIAHGPTYKPPPPPPYDKIIIENIRDLIPPPLTPFAGGPKGPNSHGGLPSVPAGPGAPSGQGGMTKKTRGPTSSEVTWEHWWARNRYQYLQFPNIGERASRLFPSTYDAPPVSPGRTSIEAERTRLLPMIRPLLNDKAARLRRAALISLGMLDDSESLPEMIKLLKDGNQTVRDAAILALGIMEDREARHVLLHMARGTRIAGKSLDQSSVPDYVRAFSQISLALGRTKGINGVLRSIAEESTVSLDVRAMALEALGLSGDEEGAEFLMAFIEEGRDHPLLLAAAVAALAKTRNPLALPLLKKCLFSEFMPVRQSAALGLGAGFPGDRADLVKCLQRGYRHTNDLALRGFSLLSMGRIGGPDVVEGLVQVIAKGGSSDCPWACLGLGFALRNSSHEAAVKQLVEHAFTHPNRSTRGAAVIALGISKCRDAMKSLIEGMIHGDDPAFRGYCAMALGMIGDSTALGPMRRVMDEDPMPQVKTQVATALALMNDTDSFPALVDLLIHSPNDSIKTFASLSLAFMGDIRIAADLNKRLADEKLDELTRAHCTKLSARLLSGRTAPYLEPLAAGSNFASEFPLVGYLLDFGL